MSSLPETSSAEHDNRTRVQPEKPTPTIDVSNDSTNPTLGTLPPGGVTEYPFLSRPLAADEIGRLGEYRILKKLGEGGMGYVFRGEDPALKRYLALKVMRPEVAAKPQAAERFLREGRAAAGLKSDHIITIYQVGQANGVPFLAMEFLEGLPLDEWFKAQKKAIPLPQVLRVVRDTLRGLAVAHDKGLIHRDIKPANLWIEKGTSRIKLLDFGLTRGNESDMQLTQEGAVVGTPAYMAPEQASGKPVDPRADLFSVGTVMYQLLAGKNPFARGNLMETLGAVGFETQPPVSTVRADVPKEYSDFLDRLLAKAPDGRPAHAKAALGELAAIEKALQETAKTVASSTTSHLVATPVVEKPQPQVWNDLTEPDTAAPVRKALARKKGPLEPPNNKKLLYGGGLFAFLAVLGGIVIIITNKDGTQTKVELPDGAKVEVKDKGKTVASVGGNTGAPAKPNAESPPITDSGKPIDLFREKSVWVGDNPRKVLTVEERKGDSFRATFEIGDKIERVVTGSIKHGQLTWMAKDVRAVRGGVGDDNYGTFGKDEAGPKIDIAWQGSNGKGTFTLRLDTNDRKPLTTTSSSDSERAFAEWAVQNGATVGIRNNSYQSIKSIDQLPVESFDVEYYAQDRAGASNFTEADIERFRPLQKLNYITLASPISDSGLARFAAMPKASKYIRLIFENCSVSDEGLKVVSRFTSLLHFSMHRNQRFTGRGLAYFKGSDLGALTLNIISSLEDDSLAVLADLPKLAVLVINSSNISDAGMKWIGRAGQLTQLQLISNVKVTDAGFKHLEKLQKLEILEYMSLSSHKDLTGASFESVGKLKNLKKLIATQHKITDADLQHLVNLEQLEFVDLKVNKGITDAAVPIFGKMKSMKHLKIKGTSITAEGVKSLKAMRPDLKIESDFE